MVFDPNSMKTEHEETDKILAEYFDGGDLSETDLESVAAALDDAWNAGWAAASEYYTRPGASFK